MPADLTLIIRARDEAASLDRCLRLIGAQEIGRKQLEVVLVDAGSRDRTPAVAASHGARVIELSQSQFTFGRAVNVGAANAQGDLLVALSAHAFPPDSGWLRRLAEAFSDSDVACATGDRYDPDGAPLMAPVKQDLALARRRPEWGYSNAAGAFRAELWRRRQFNEDLPGCEDKEWAWHWLSQGYVCMVDPSLAVEHDHSHDALSGIYRRARREALAYAQFAELPEYGVRDLAREWWWDLRWYRSAARARLSHRRAARLLGTYAGRRSVR